MNDQIQVMGVGAVFIDDIVLPDGTTYMDQLGGGVVHALMGAAVWDEQPGIVALAGHDLPETARQQLGTHFDTQGLHFLSIPQIRAWQIFEADGTRRELYRVAITDPFTAGAQPQHLPDAYRHSRAAYLLQDFEGIQEWSQALSGIILWEPLQQIMQPGNRQRLRQCLQNSAIDVISPNLAEAQAVYGAHPAADLIAMLLEDGAQAVALRMGSEGSWVASPNEWLHIPAIPVARLVDQTGAGNTYCGAFLTGLARDMGMAKAARMGTVAASFCVEQIGTLDPGAVQKQERDRRYQHLVTKG